MSAKTIVSLVGNNSNGTSRGQKKQRNALLKRRRRDETEEHAVEGRRKRTQQDARRVEVQRQSRGGKAKPGSERLIDWQRAPGGQRGVSEYLGQ